MNKCYCGHRADKHYVMGSICMVDGCFCMSFREEVPKQYHATCYVCGKDSALSPDTLTGYVEPGKVLVAMHTKCANEKRIDVCATCQKVVSIYDIVDETHVCKNCKVTVEINFDSRRFDESIRKTIKSLRSIKEKDFISEERLKELEELAENATPGPWIREGGSPPSVSTCASVSSLNPNRVLPHPYTQSTPYFMGICQESEYDANWYEGWKDLEFIAASREAVPELIAEVRRLRKLYLDLRGD